MRRFTLEDVVSIFTDDHRRNTAYALQKDACDVTPVELIHHWVLFHPMDVVQFNVDPADDVGDEHLFV